MLKILATVTVFASSPAFSQAYPNKTVRIVTTELGGGTDFVARLVAQGLTSNLGQQVIIDNRPSGVIPGQVVSKAVPDGYTLLAYGGTFWIGPLLQDNVPYDPVRDFLPITLAASSPNVLVVHPSLPVKSTAELIALAKARPGVLNYASAAIGSASHLAAELFKSMARVDIVRINYKGSGAALTDVLSGQVHVMFSLTVAAAPHVRSGRLRALGVTSLQPSALAPGLPTIAATGLSGYEYTSAWGFFAPAKTPALVTNVLNKEIVRVLQQGDVKEKFSVAGMEIVASSPEQLATKINSDVDRMGKLIKKAGIREK